jgi:hypothetical protein
MRTTSLALTGTGRIGRAVYELMSMMAALTLALSGVACRR